MIRWFLSGTAVLTCAILAYNFWPDDPLPAGKNIDKIIVLKSERIMNVYSAGQLVKTYKISLGTSPIGDKQQQGDRKTPEGRYAIDGKNPNSAFYKNIGVSYPSRLDIAEARKQGVDPGGEIKIHGLRNGLGFVGRFHTWFNWTAGCIAVTNDEIDELYESVGIGTPIIIEP